MLIDFWVIAARLTFVLGYQFPNLCDQFMGNAHYCIGRGDGCFILGHSVILCLSFIVL